MRHAAWLLLLLAILATPAFAAIAPGLSAPPTAPIAVPALPADVGLPARFHGALGQVENKLVRLVAAAPLLLVALLIVVLSAWLGRVVSRRRGWLHLRSHNPYMDGLVRRVLQLLVLLAGVLVALDLLGATSLVGALLGSAGLVGLVLGFAFKDIAENYVAGILLSLRQPFAPGDHVVIDAHEGRIVALTSRTTLLMTLDGNHLSLPNALVFKSVVLNYTTNPKRRFEFRVPLDLAASIRTAQSLAMQEIPRIAGVLEDPAPSWQVVGYAEGGMVLQLFGWIDQRHSDLARVRSEAMRAVKSAYARAGIETPRSVQYLVETPASRVDAQPTGAQPEAPGSTDTSVNRDIDRQLAAAQSASPENLLTDAKPLIAPPLPPADEPPE